MDKDIPNNGQIQDEELQATARQILELFEAAISRQSRPPKAKTRRTSTARKIQDEFRSAIIEALSKMATPNEDKPFQEKTAERSTNVLNEVGTTSLEVVRADKAPEIEEIVSPNSITSNKFFIKEKNTLLDGKTRKAFADDADKLKKNGEGTMPVYYTFRLENTGAKVLPINLFTRRVLNTVCSIWCTGHSLFTTIELIRAMIGEENTYKPTRALINKVDEVLDFLSSIRAVVDATEQFKKYCPEETKTLLKGYVCPLNEIQVWRKSNPQPSKGYKVIAEPILFAHADKVNQIQRFPREWLVLHDVVNGELTNTRVPMTANKITAQEFLFERLGNMLYIQKYDLKLTAEQERRRRKNTPAQNALRERKAQKAREQKTRFQNITLKSAYEAFEIDVTNPKRRKDVRQDLALQLDNFKLKGIIKNWHFTKDDKDKKTLKSIHIDLWPLY